MARRTGDPVLEIGCGTGRVLLPLARDGVRVVGLDISPAMLSRARARLAASGIDEARARLIQSDAVEFRLEERFALAFCALNTFMHFTTPAAQAGVLRRVHEHLLPDGVLVLDLYHPHPDALHEADGRLIHDFTRPGPADGAISTRFHTQRIDPARQIMEITFFYDEQGADGTLRRTTAPFELYYFHRREVEMLLEANGYLVEAVYGTYDLEPYWSGSQKLLVVARRA